MSQPCDLAAVEALEQIKSKSLSPLELFESCVSRIESINPTVNAVVATLTDISDLKKAERQLRILADIDPLTGALNRRAFTDVVAERLRRTSDVAILYCDLNGFKPINDTYGHAAGDQGIQFIAGVLRACFPDALCLARLGGDEFGVVAPTVSAEETTVAYQRFIAQVAAGAPSETKTPFSITVSVGVAISNVGGTSARELLTTADRALYAAKEAGRNQVKSSVINV